MKAVMTIAALAGLMLGGCATAPHSYRTDVKVSPTASPHQYKVDFNLAEVGPDGAATTMSSPSITLNAGKEGQISVCDDQEKDGLFCKALVKENKDSVEVSTRVMLKAKGRETFNSAQSMVVTK